MTKLDDLFRQRVDAFSHPRLRNWKERLAQPGCEARLELYRPAAAFGLAQTEMYLHFTKDGKEQPLETILWDDELNAGLIDLHIRSVDEDNEAQRFALGIRGAMRKATREYGDGYFNSVLFEYINDSDLRNDPAIADVLAHAYALQPSRESKGYNNCRQMIEDALKGRLTELGDKLDYPEDTAKRILLQALAHYLDERFTVSSRRRMGLL